MLFFLFSFSLKVNVSNYFPPRCSELLLCPIKLHFFLGSSFFSKLALNIAKSLFTLDYLQIFWTTVLSPFLLRHQDHLCAHADTVFSLYEKIRGMLRFHTKQANGHMLTLYLWMSHLPHYVLNKNSLLVSNMCLIYISS